MFQKKINWNLFGNKTLIRSMASIPWRIFQWLLAHSQTVSTGENIPTLWKQLSGIPGMRCERFLWMSYWEQRHTMWKKQRQQDVAAKSRGKNSVVQRQRGVSLWTKPVVEGSHKSVWSWPCICASSGTHPLCFYVPIQFVVLVLVKKQNRLCFDSLIALEEPWHTILFESQLELLPRECT